MDSIGRILFLRNHRGELELPGGKPELGESMEEALAREVMEECGYSVTDAVYLCSRSCLVVAESQVLLAFFRCSHAGGAIHISDEHRGCHWVEVTGAKPADLPDFYWSVVSRLVPE